MVGWQSVAGMRSGRVRVGDWGWMRKGGRTLGVSRGGGSGGGGGGPTEGGEDRDTKGFDVQPFHRLYFSAPFYPFAARALARHPTHHPLIYS